MRRRNRKIPDRVSYRWVSLDICTHLQISVGIFKYLPASSDICEYLQIFVGIFRYLRASSDICRCEPHFNKILTCHMEDTESLPAPPGTHEAGRLPPSLAYEAQVCLTLAWPGRAASLRAICRPTWPLANAVSEISLIAGAPHTLVIGPLLPLRIC